MAHPNVPVSEPDNAMRAFIAWETAMNKMIQNGNILPSTISQKEVAVTNTFNEVNVGAQPFVTTPKPALNVHTIIPFNQWPWHSHFQPVPIPFFCNHPCCRKRLSERTDKKNEELREYPQIRHF